MPIYTVNKRKLLVMSSRLSKQPRSARKEFFGPGAPRSSDTSATDVPPEDSEPTSADQRPARKRSVSKLLAELQPSSGWVQAGPVLPAKVRASSASRARDPADLNSDGRSQAAPTGSTSAAAVFSKAVSQIKKPSKQSSRSNSEAFPVVGSVPTKVRRTMNADAPAFVPLGVRIPVHLAPDCEWDDEQILAADDLRRSQAAPGQFYSTGSASTNVPSHIPHPQAEEVTAGLSDQAADEFRDPESASSRSSSEIAPKKRAATKKSTKPRKRAVKAAAAQPEAVSTKADRRPRVLWSNEAPARPQPIPRPTNVTFMNFRKTLPGLPVPVKTPPPSSGEDQELILISNSSDEEAHKRPRSPAPDREDSPQAADMQPIPVLLVVRPSTTKDSLGACMFNSLAQSLAHILETDLSAFGTHSTSSAKEAIQALTNPAIMRQAICDHLCGIFADTPVNSLQGQSPRQAALMDYVEYGQPLHDHDWVPPAGVFPVPASQSVSNFPQYVSAMRKKGAYGDEICLAACADLLNLRHIVYDTRGFENEGAMKQRMVALSLDLHPEHTKEEMARFPTIMHQGKPAFPQVNPERRLSSRMPIILLRSGMHFDWMHCESDLWNEPKALDAFELIVAGTYKAVPELYNPAGFQPHQAPIDRDFKYPVTADPLMRPLPCDAIIRAQKRRRDRVQVASHLVQEMGISETHAEVVISFYECDTGLNKIGRHASMHCMPALEKICLALNRDTDPLCNCRITSHAQPTCHCRSTENASLISEPHSKFLSPASERRTNPVTGPRPDRILAADREVFKPKIVQTSSQTDFDNAVTSLMMCTNISKLTAEELISRHSVGYSGSLLFKPLRTAFQEVKQTRETAEANKQVPSQAPLVHPAVHNPANVLADSRADFIAKNLGNDTRAMTANEVMQASKDQRRMEFTGCPSAIIPRNLEKYWMHHQNQAILTPRGHHTHAQHQQRLRQQAYDALHQEACKAASLASKRVIAEPGMAAITQPIPAAPAQFTSQEHDMSFRKYDAPACDPNTTTWRDSQEVAATPQSACHPAVLASLKEAFIAAPPGHVQPQPMAIQKLPQTIGADHAHIPKPHPSPQVRLAQDREKLVLAKEANFSNQISIVVDTGMLPANSVIWKAGKQTDGAGFNYSAYAGVKASWEQANSDKGKGYRTIKSFIDPRFISTICDNISIERSRYDLIQDSELLQLLEDKLRPKDSTIYYVKINCFKISANPADGSLSTRYCTFADAFMAIVSEARDAGTPLSDETIRTAFRSACNSDGLLRMYLGAEKWVGVQSAHQRIYNLLQSFEAHHLEQSLSSGTPMEAATARGADAASPAVTPAAPQRQIYTPEQRREYQLARQQQLFASQQQVLANTVHQQVDLAVSNRMNQITLPVQQPAHQPAHIFAPPMANNSFAFPRPPVQPLQQTQLVSAPHPGLDSRGPYWHVHGPLLSCRVNPCTAFMFCQGCGLHGHCSADCRRRSHPGWNASGYYCDRYPGSGSLPYAQPKPAAPYNQFSQPAAGTQMLQQPVQPLQQPRIPPPPQHLTPSNPFPTPFKMNNTTRTPAPPQSSVHVNASTQLSATPSLPGAAASADQQ